MKLSEIRGVLNAFADIERLERNSSLPTALEVLARGLVPPSDATVAATIKKLSKVNLVEIDVDRPSNTGVTCQELSAYLSTSSKALLAAKAKPASADFASLAELLKKTPDRDVGPVAQQILTALNAAPAKKKAAAKQPVKIDFAKVRTFADRLTAANMDGSRFHAILEELQSKGAVTNAELYAIADQYTGGKSKYKSKADAIKRMKSRQYQDVLHESRAEVIRRVQV